jgi:hypothetical protein
MAHIKNLRDYQEKLESWQTKDKALHLEALKYLEEALAVKKGFLETELDDEGGLRSIQKKCSS